jgi:hypothetical protein
MITEDRKWKVENQELRAGAELKPLQRRDTSSKIFVGSLVEHGSHENNS